ncbi:leucine zipper transcription factor-like protein 1 [Protopterus annectens]|uniref:leucine zipper transcription factor-like protein 1 n=1 Tax=Protopterus annectens TaxID=7888 RepID=UPI001CFA10B4|nr:leucine zipper transcription factor-like protein 1 [Protopterus annectens]
MKMSELGLNDHHQNEVLNYMRFARTKSALKLKTVDSCFQDLKGSRLVEETFTVDEVTEMLEGLQAVVHSEVESELINTSHTNVLLLRQLFSQAEKWYLKLQTDISELENRELLEQIAEFEKTEPACAPKKSSLQLALYTHDKSSLKEIQVTLCAAAADSKDVALKVQVPVEFGSVMKVKCSILTCG